MRSVTPNESFDNRNNLTLGSIQRTIKKGLPQNEVLMAIGSPNIITKDSGKETWVYDKIYTESISNETKGSIGAIGIGGTSVGYGGGSGKHSDVRTSQHTLTVIIKFDKENLVEEVLYHSSRY